MDVICRFLYEIFIITVCERIKEKENGMQKRDKLNDTPAGYFYDKSGNIR
jgi:hypothetical protein